ncbi:uncharacterized protein LOC131231049 [Magnolia sinica]|uniref:uncharacterized protein LOC131231049 n=1 Tax=Magnolia sinica TaxID=86752 RepID=UPI002658C148|nr:uncharacterized protein LOC131231049 [Magnolia sinica]
MGKYVACWARAFAGKVILPDGSVHEFDSPLTVAELMLDHPQHFVAEFRSIVAGNKPAPLPADQTLKLEKVYVMVPQKGGRAVALSADETRRILSKASSVLRFGWFPSQVRILPLLRWMCPVSVRKGEEFVLDKKAGPVENAERSGGRQSLTDGIEGRVEYLNRQISGKAWKPTLDTIKETGAEKKVPHWLF